MGECEFDRCEIVLKLVEAFRANDDRGYHRLCSRRTEEAQGLNELVSTLGTIE